MYMISYTHTMISYDIKLPLITISYSRKFHSDNASLFLHIR